MNSSKISKALVNHLTIKERYNALQSLTQGLENSKAFGADANAERKLKDWGRLKSKNILHCMALSSRDDASALENIMCTSEDVTSKELSVSWPELTFHCSLAECY